MRQEVLTEIKCDRCGARVHADAVLEAQEWIRIRIDGGFSSIFGDGAQLACDLCQKCAKTVLGPFLKPIEESTRNILGG